MFIISRIRPVLEIGLAESSCKKFLFFKYQAFNHKMNSRGLLRGQYWTVAALVLISIRAGADTVIVESKRSGALDASGITPDPPYSEVAGTWYYSSSKSTAPGCTPSVGSRYAAADAAFRVTPTLGERSGAYFIDVTFAVNAASTTVLVGLNAVGATLSTNTTTAFQYAPGMTSSWIRVGTLLLNPGSNAPAITFTASNVTTEGGPTRRFYADAVRFLNVNDLCLNTPQLPDVNASLAAGQTSVEVPGVDGAASAITVYANGVAIGEKNGNIVAGLDSVATSPLAKGQIITATQTKDGIESCRVPSGPKVGGGANPRIRVALSIRENTALTGPIGADGGTVSSKVVFLGATGEIAGKPGNAPSGGRVIFPSRCWQMISFLRGSDPANPVDPTFVWAGAGAGASGPLEGSFGVLEAIAFVIDDLTDSGPFGIYIDNLRNGSTLIQDFESAQPGDAEVLFQRPSASSSTAAFLMSGLDIAQVSNANADTGTNSAFISWQFRDTTSAAWVRLSTQGLGTPNPQLDLNQPISFRLLLLPPGANSVSPSETTPPRLDFRPEAGGDLLLCWPMTCPDYTLQTKARLDPLLPWMGLTNRASPLDGMNCISLELIGGQSQFFRLYRPSP
jgi:hypothetical protein